MKDFKIEKDFMIDEYRCLIVGHSLGHRCGYVGIPQGHALYGIDYTDINVNVHGTLTFSSGDDIYDVDSNGLWWIGFDCAHCDDGKDFELIRELNDARTSAFMISIESMFPIEGEVARTKEYVEEELIRLVNQLTDLQAIEDESYSDNSCGIRIDKIIGDDNNV
jgi:hypothetical protein